MLDRNEVPRHFERDKDAAISFGEERARAFEAQLELWEKHILQDVRKDNFAEARITNMDLDLFSGDALATKIDEEVLKDRDLLFNREGRSTNEQIVHLYFRPSQLNLSNWDEDHVRISRARFQELANNYQYMIHKGFLIADLVSNNIYVRGGERLIVRLRVPIGTGMVYVGGSTVLLKRNQGIEFFDWRITTEEGREVMLFDASLVPTERVIRRVRIGEESLNTQLSNALAKANNGKEINRKTKLVETDFSSLRAHAAFVEAKEGIDYLINQLPSVILRDIFTKKHSKQTGQLTLNFHDTIFEVDKDGKVVEGNGFTDHLYNRIHLFPTRVEGDLRTVLHEMAHAIDVNLLSVSLDKQFSLLNNFNKLFGEESQNLTEETSYLVGGIPYGATNSIEFFAEVFSAMYSSNATLRDLIWKQVPRTCQYIKDSIEKYIETHQQSHR